MAGDLARGRTRAHATGDVQKFVFTRPTDVRSSSNGRRDYPVRRLICSLITGTNPGNTAGGAGDDTIIIVGNRAFHVEGESVTITGNQGYSIRGDDVTLDGIGHDYVYADGSCTVNGEAIACAGAIGEGDKYGDGGYTAYAADDDTNP